MFHKETPLTCLSSGPAFKLTSITSQVKGKTPFLGQSEALVIVK